MTAEPPNAMCLHAQAWDDLADKEDAWADKVQTFPHIPGDLPHDPQYHRKNAAQYRNVALSMRMQDETGTPHCACTNPPHSIDYNKQKNTWTLNR